MGQGIQDGPSKIRGIKSLKNLKWYNLLRHTISLQIFKKLSPANFIWSIPEHLDPFISSRKLVFIVTLIVY